MRFRQIGAIPLNVSEIAFGTGDTAGGIIYGTPQHQLELVTKALELGINLFDCSPDYGKGLGEANLGRVLKELNAKDIFIITKVEIMPEDIRRIYDRVHESVHDSLLRLQRDHVDVIMLHNPCKPERNDSIRTWMPLSPSDVRDEILPALLAVKAAGKARYIGMACERSDPASVRALLQTREFAMINGWYNLTDPSAGSPHHKPSNLGPYSGLFDACREADVGVAVIRPLAGGALTNWFLEGGHASRPDVSRGPLRDNPSRMDKDIALARRLQFLAQSPNSTLSQAAYRYILSNSAVSTIVGGFSEISQIEEAAKSSDLGSLSNEEMRQIDEAQQRGTSRT